MKSTTIALFAGILTFCNILTAAPAENGLPALLLGAPWDAKSVENDIFRANNLKCVRSEKWIEPSEYHNYSVVYLGEGLKQYPPGSNWSSPKDCEEVRQYVKNGGIIILAGGVGYNLTGRNRDLSLVGDILGFSRYDTFVQKTAGIFTFSDPGFGEQFGPPEAPYNWQQPSSATVAGITTAEILGYFKGTPDIPAFTVNKLGQGAVYFIAPTLMRLGQGKKSLGEADEAGTFIPNRDGQSIQMLTKLMLYLFQQSASLKTPEQPRDSSWGLKPLGAPGVLKLSKAFAGKPVFKEKSVTDANIRLSENGKPLADIVIPPRAPGPLKQLAKELQYHLNTITGGNFQITDKPADKLAIVLEMTAENRVHIKTTDDRIVLSGNTETLPMAVMYFLEKLGCRYLWPGVDGKIIPRQPDLAAKKLDFAISPALAIRQVRRGSVIGGRADSGLARCGIAEPEEFARMHREQSLDHPGNSDFYRWHGYGGRNFHNWGHAFGDYYKRFGKSHPEYFSLQFNGSRSQDASPDRPRLCMSNPDLALQAAQDCIRYFDENPRMLSKSICLNDGGATPFCLCEECRKLDPVNAPAIRMPLRLLSGNTVQPYVSLTDRMLEFSNRIAEKVAEKYPDRKLTIYAYSLYEAPPVKIQPRKNLMIFVTSMTYTNENARRKVLESMAEWASFGNPFFWRPNALWGHNRILAPQNYARKIFNDLELFKANRLEGTDFDCNELYWAFKPLVYYALAKAHWNPDRLDYDAILDDFCQNGFGRAAEPVKKYFTLLEELTDRAAEKNQPYLEFFDENAIAALDKLLDEALSAEEAPEVRRRIEFLRIGVRGGELNRKLYTARKEENMDKYKKLQEEFRAYIRRTALASPLALNPGTLGFYNQFLQ